MFEPANIQLLKAKVESIKSDIKLKEAELRIAQKELLEVEWPVMTWADLENWLKVNRPNNVYDKNPYVKSLDGISFYYCKLNKEGKLQIGPYEHTDGFPNGKPIRVAYDFRNWR